MMYYRPTVQVIFLVVLGGWALFLFLVLLTAVTPGAPL